MKAPGSKFIGINQRVPYPVLDQALGRWLQTGALDREGIARDMQTFTKGANRAHKATQYAVTIFSRSEKILEVLKAHLPFQVYIKLPDHERKALVNAMVACAFPFAYDLMVAIAASLKAQAQISKAAIEQKIAAQYGSNRTVEVGIEAVLPMLIEMGVLARLKPGIYTLGKTIALQNTLVSEIYLFVDIHCSGSKSVLLKDLEIRPWFLFHPVLFDKEVRHHLVHYAAGGIGGGYITIN
jgi:hypothetical protein